MASGRHYFHVPPAGGFSPYRTGQVTHLLLSACESGVASWLMGRVPGMPVWAAVVAAAIAPVALWGPGWKIGVASHYNILLTLAALAGAVALVFTAPQPGGLGILVGSIAHPIAAAVISHVNRGTAILDE
jgi:hypothetical protein